MTQRAIGAKRGPDLPYKLVAGVEPVPSGWLIASAKLVGSQLAPEPPRVEKEFETILNSFPAYSAIAAHIPIGLLSRPRRGGRTCDHEARQLLGWPRMAAVLSPPAKAVLKAQGDYERAVKLNGGHLDVITFRLLGKIAEVTSVVQPYHQRMLYEVQPELVFYHLNQDKPLRYSKRGGQGVEEREDILRRRISGSATVLDAKLPRVRKQHLVDACADMWAARLIVAKGAARLPENPEWNDDGLRMEILR